MFASVLSYALTHLQNRDVSRSIISALAPPSPEDGASYRVAVLTYPSQEPYLPCDIPASGIQHKTSDFTPASLESAFAGQDLVISAIAGGNYEFQRTIVDAVIASGVDRFMPHVVEHDVMNEEVQRRIPNGLEHRKLLQYLQTERSQRFEWVGVAVGCILDPPLLTGNLGFDFEWQSGTINGSGDEIFPVSSLERVGFVVKSVILHWQLVKNRFVYAAGALTSGNELVVSLEKMTKSKWTIGYSGVDECVREGESRIERGFPDSGMFLLQRSVLYDKSLRATDPFRRQTANGLLGLEPQTVDKIVSQAYHEFERRGKPSCGCGN